MTINMNNTNKPPIWTLTNIGVLVAVALLISAILTAFQQDNIETGTETTLEDPFNLSPPTSGPVALAPGLMEENFKLLTGESGKLADYKGKVLLIDIWATWCGPCRESIPHMVKLAEEYKNKGVEVIGLTTERDDPDEQYVKDFSKNFKINYPIGWANPRLENGLKNGRGGIPQTIIVGRDGIIKYHKVGFHPINSVPQIKAVLDEALGSE
jgi:thiol-disulfide isomerase/thioredoxin